MTQRLDQITPSMTTNTTTAAQDEQQPLLSSAFEQSEIQTTLENTRLKATQLTHIPNYDNIPASTRRIKPLNNFLGQDRARAFGGSRYFPAIFWLQYFCSGYGGIGQTYHGQAFAAATCQEHAHTE